MPRLFVAIDLPATIKARLAELVPFRDDVHRIQPAQYHLTLRFVGDCGDIELARLLERLGEIQVSPFSFSIDKPGVFPSMRKPRVLWIGVRAGTPLFSLQAAVERAAKIDMATNVRSQFRPHITLARLKHPDRNWLRDFLDNCAEMDAGDVEVKVFHLFSSTLHPNGAIHVRLADFPLGA